MDYDPYTAEWITDKDTNRKRKFFTNKEEQERLQSRAKAMMAQVRQQREDALDDVPLIQRQWRMHQPNEQGSYPFGFWAIQNKIDKDYADMKKEYERRLRYRRNQDPWSPVFFAESARVDEEIGKRAAGETGPFGNLDVPIYDSAEKLKRQFNVK